MALLGRVRPAADDCVQAVLPGLTFHIFRIGEQDLGRAPLDGVVPCISDLLRCFFRKIVRMQQDKGRGHDRVRIEKTILLRKPEVAVQQAEQVDLAVLPLLQQLAEGVVDVFILPAGRIGDALQIRVAKAALVFAFAALLIVFKIT